MRCRLELPLVCCMFAAYFWIVERPTFAHFVCSDLIISHGVQTVGVDVAMLIRTRFLVLVPLMPSVATETLSQMTRSRVPVD